MLEKLNDDPIHFLGADERRLKKEFLKAYSLISLFLESGLMILGLDLGLDPDGLRMRLAPENRANDDRNEHSHEYNEFGDNFRA